MVTELTKREDGLGFTVDTHNFSESRSAVPMANTEDLFLLHIFLFSGPH